MSAEAIGLFISLALAALAAWALVERRRALVELESARKICDLGNDPVLVADILEGRILHANPSACAMLGLSYGELTSRTLPTLHPPELMAKSAEVIADVWDKKGLVSSELPMLRKDGERIDVEMSANIIEFGGKPAVLIYARDIRERVRAEQKIRQYATDLESTNRQLREMQAQLVMSEKMASLGSLVAGVAHELNTPIGAIHANSDTAQRAIEAVKKGLADPKAAEAIAGNERLKRALGILEDTSGVIRNASSRVSAIVKSLKNFARLDEAERKRASVHQGLDSTIDLIGYQLQDRIEVVKSYGDLPEIECYPSRLNQVFMNILVNAVQAIEGKGKVEIRTRAADGCAIVEITDTGKGISPEHLPRIFDPGFTTKGVGVGTGLGLSIAYRIVKDHEGTIEAKSEPGRGTTMIVRLPIK